MLAIEFGGWTIQSAPFIVVGDQKANILGRNLLLSIGIKLIQEQTQHKQVLKITEENTSNPVIKQWVIECFINLGARIGKAKNHVLKTQFISDVHRFNKRVDVFRFIYNKELKMNSTN